MMPDPPGALHLTYGLNIHRGETWAEHRDAIRGPAAAVKARVAPGAPFGLGLRLGDDASRELMAPGCLAEFRDELAAAGMYAFTINGFPFGRFHGTRVKEEVYAPDWQTPARLEYTLRLAQILAALLPEGVEGSISTVPGSYRAWISGEDNVRAMALNLGAAAAALAALRERTGRTIHLGLEPEPDCFIETTAEFLRFFEEELLRGAPGEAAVRRHLGVCVDTCHLAIVGEDAAAALAAAGAAGARVSKIQLSAALTALNTPAGRAALSPFAEPVYFHQTRAYDPAGVPAGEWPDLAPALEELPGLAGAAEARVHFHVPLFWAGAGPLGTTRSNLNAEFWRRARAATSHWEIETYTFDVLPAEMRAGGVVPAICGEYAWVLENARGGGLASGFRFQDER